MSGKKGGKKEEKSGITFSLRRMGQAECQSGLTETDLRALADWAHLHPMDEISVDGRHWIHVHEFKALGMVWYILVDREAIYGPTTVGTLKEFFVHGEIAPEQRLRHAQTKEEKSLEEVIGKDYVREVLARSG
ncbi:MAG: hypothetical protein SFU85_10670 [Candidatus Methylacidiphilales bacterium]|nr:hypothetical protein [Candidatus Methylacidiphilales bacterium]